MLEADDSDCYRMFKQLNLTVKAFTFLLCFYTKSDQFFLLTTYQCI